MSRALSMVGLAALLAAGVAGGIGLADRLESNPPALPTGAEAAATLQKTFNRATAIATQAVVHITIGSEGQGTDSVGSGVVVTPQGHIITNYHVIRDVEECLVRFVDGPEFLATVKGRDPELDLAILQIDPKGRHLQPIVFADSDKVRVGDIVFAIGSPFGYTHTATSGIVSAKHRVLEMGKPFEDYLQTDAAINPGNSGGALVNLNGELVGVNAAMGSGSRTNEGVGLAISSNLVKWVKERLIRDGIVRRARLGVSVAELHPKTWDPGLKSRPRFQGARTAEDVATLLGLQEPTGAMVAKVWPGTPAAVISMRPLDVIVEFDGRPIRSIYELAQKIVEMEPGRTVKLKFVRDKAVQESIVTLDERDHLPGALPPAKPPK